MIYDFGAHVGQKFLSLSGGMVYGRLANNFVFIANLSVPNGPVPGRFFAFVDWPSLD